ncbi:MAG: DsbA family oxidoreductase [Burkholderiales bacterium]
MPLQVDVISDVVCPWCYIGKQRLDEALSQWRRTHPDDEIEVNWHAFQLNPGMPVEGMDRQTYVAEKFGGPERAREIYARVTAAGRDAGIDFDFSRMQIQPNTRQAHRLIAWASEQGRQHALVDALFRAYFLSAHDLTQDSVLAGIAAEAGLDREAAGVFLASDSLADAVAEDEALARDLQVQGVPFFIINRRLALSGAQPADVISQAIREATA